MTRQKQDRIGRVRPVHYAGKRDRTVARCGATTVVPDVDRHRVTCRKCLSEIGPSWWRLQLERKPGDWIDTPTVRKITQRPRPLPYDEGGRANRWVTVGGMAQWA